MHKLMTRIAQAMAILGGLVLAILIVMICISVLGRGINTIFHTGFMETLAPGLSAWVLSTGVGPVLGDFELVEAGMPFAVFAFLPLAQMTSSHATVDVFTTRFPESVLRVMRAVTEIVFACVLVIFALKLNEGMEAKMRYNETTFLIQFPIWWAYAVSLFGAVVAALVGIYSAYVRVVEMLTGRKIAEDLGEAGH